MDERIELLVSLAASTAANCVPCFEYYYKKASAAGISAEEIRRAVELACKVKTGAGIVMKNSIRDITGQEMQPGQSECGKNDHPCCG